MVMLCKKMEKEELKLFVKVAGNNRVAQIKEDGDRMRIRIKDKKATLYNRPGKEVTEKYPEFHGEIDLPDCFLDGEICVIIDGVSKFSEGIAHRTHCNSIETITDGALNYPVTFVVFDILELKGLNLKTDSQQERMTMLVGLLMSCKDRYDTDLITLIKESTNIISLWEEALRIGAEGIVIKDINAIYEDGKRSKSWLKVKDVHETDLEFTKYEIQNRGITLENEDGIRVVVNGAQAEEVKQAIPCMVTIRHLGPKTPKGKYRQPTFMKLVVEE